ncbi:MAG: ATP-binding cassette domain-containing protein [Gemmatimonadota bacterium]
MKLVLDVRDLRYEVQGRAIVEGITFVVAAGETLVLLGRSGAGKSTTLKLTNRLLTPTAGAVRIAGDDARTQDVVRLRRRMGYVIQEIGLFPHMTVAENIGLLPRLEHWPKERASERVRDLLGLVGLDPETFAGRYPHQLSGGQRQRVGVARALAIDPPILLLDEPFGALDPVTRVELQHEFKKLAATLGKAVVFVTHDVREGLLVGTRVGLLDGGRIVFQGTPSEFRASALPQVRQFLESAA